uniref:Uncharacterized protein n=1 Tax=Panagrolaimus sp. PS1159 TaxID=55785 RepID=A0AC35ER89_9BILA
MGKYKSMNKNVIKYGKAKGLKKAAPSSYNEATVFPTRRVTKKHIRKLMNQKRREEKAAERAANQMELN